MKIFKIYTLSVLLFFAALSACNTEGVKLSSEDRNAIDTLSLKQITLLSVEMDKWCRDSSPRIKQRLIDSLMLVREQEILQQTRAIPIR